MTMLSYEKCDEIVKKLAPELLLGTGMQLTTLMHTGRALQVCEHVDAYEVRVGISEPFTRIVRRIEIGAESCHDETALVQALTSGIDKARGDLFAELTKLAAKVAPRLPIGASSTYGKCEP